MDQYTDSNGSIMSIINGVKQIPQFVKQAYVVEKESIPDNMFAYLEKRAFPICDRANTYMSTCYYIVNRDKIPDKVRTNLEKAAHFFKIENEVLDFAKKYIQLEKQAKKEIEKEAYAIPKKKAYPLQTKDHYAMAVPHFEKHHKEYPLKDRIKIAKKIVKFANNNNMPVCSHIVIQYTKPMYMDKEKTAAMLMSRAFDTCIPEKKKLFRGLGLGFQKFAQPNDFMKIASLLEKIDDNFLETKPEHDFLEVMFQPMQKKASDEVVNIAGKEIPLGQLMIFPEEFYDEALGEDIVRHMKINEALDARAVKAVIESLPMPEKKVLLFYIENAVGE
jgi:hypothetical protein